MLTLGVCACVLLLHSCPTLCDPMNCSPPGSSVRGIFQARILEWVAIRWVIEDRVMGRTISLQEVLSPYTILEGNIDLQPSKEAAAVGCQEHSL